MRMPSALSLTRRKVISRIALAGCVVAWGTASAAYPDKPVRMLVGYPGGDTSDLVARVAAHALGEFFRQPFIIETHAGGNGNVATARAAKARPDGYTVLLVATPFTANTSLYPQLRIDPLADFAPVSRVAIVHQVLLVRESAGVKSVAE